MKRALALSVLVHALFLIWAALQPPRPALPKDSPIELAFFELFTPREAPAPRAAPPAEPSPRPRPPPRPLVAMKPPPPQVAAEPHEQVAPPEPLSPRPDVPVADAPMRVPGITGGGDGLVLPLAMLQLDAGYPVAESQVGRRGLRAPEVPKDLVGSTAKEALGRGRVARGMVHPYYVQLGKALIKQWDADRAVSKTGLKGFAEQTMENSQTWNRIWQEKARAYGSSGSPLGGEDDSPKQPQRPFNDRLNPYGGNPADQQARRDLQQQMNSQFKATRRALIRVVQDGEGKVSKVELVEPSNDEHVDREAVADVRAAAARMPPPPTEALEGKDELSSLWSFELVVSITPPVPTFTFEFDEVIGFIDARMPLDRRIYKKVKLVSVE